MKIKQDLKKLANPEKAQLLQGFFKTGKGEYGEGDVFLGIMVPQQRKVAKKYPDLNLEEIQKLLSSKIHEFRLTSLFILISRYKKADLKEKKKIFRFYLKNTMHINNWDLIDLSAPKIVGDYLLDAGNSSTKNFGTTKSKDFVGKDRAILYKLAKSSSLWEKRISVLATFAFIRNNEFDECLKISTLLLNDSHDLIQKAVGWMLREVGKRDLSVEEKFLMKHYKKMPRTMLRYAIERFSEKKRKFYMKR